jgi:putative ABC transport system permease protein
MDEAIVKDVYKHPEVEKITPMLMHGVFDPDKGENGAITAYLGVDPATFPSMKPYLEFRQGGWFTDDGAYEAVLGYEAAELETREAGDLMLIVGVEKPVKVVGVLARSGTQDDGTIFLPIGSVQKMFGRAGKLTGLGIKVKKEADIPAFENRLYDLPDVQVVSMAQVKTTIMNLVNSARVIVTGIAGIALIIAMAGVINTVLMSVMERYAEIGILKSMGAMPFDVFRLIWTETAILCGLGGAAGIILAFVTAGLSEAAVRYFLPYAPNGALIALDPAITGFAFLLITAGGLLSGLYPAWRAARVRPLEAIRIEGEQ